MNTPLSVQSKRRSGYWFRTAVMLLVGLIVAWYVVLAIGVYGLGWQGQKTQAVLRFTPLPVAIVQWKLVSMSEFLNQSAAVEHYSAYLQTSTTGVYQPIVGLNAQATTLTTMVKTRRLEQVARQAGIMVTPSDVTQAYQAQLLQNGNAADVAATIKQLYGWTPEQFKTNVIQSAVLRDKVQSWLSFDEKKSAPMKEQATKVLKILQSGTEDFSAVAKKYSEDVYGSNGGDLGFITKGEQTKEIDDVAFSLDINTISDAIHTKYGYHILKPLERKTIDGVDQVHVLQITILAPSVDTYTNDVLRQSRITVFARHLQWDKQNSRVSTR